MVNSFTPITTLRYWCQKVIPLVYDDSLSYYELLSKVVAKLNELIENANKQDETISALIDSFNELKYYVEHYLDTTDFQSMVNNKLEEMANDGTIATILGYSVLRYNMLHQGTMNGRIVGRERKDYYNGSLTRAMQNATVYSPSGDYSYETPKYIYYWETWSNNKNAKLMVYDTARREVINSVPISEDSHGGELVVKGTTLYSINWQSNRLYKFSLSNPALPVLSSNTAYTLSAKRLIGWYEEENCWLACNSGNTAKTVYKVTENFASQSVLYSIDTATDIAEQDWHYDDVNKIIYVAHTWSNLISVYNVLDGKQLTDYEIPNTIAYANTGELEYIFAKGEHVYWGGMHTTGASDSSRKCEFSHFYTNAYKENRTRHILYGVAGSRAIQVNYEADERNLTEPAIGGQNLVFKYVEDAFNYGKQNGTPVVINFQTDYPESFHVAYDCRLDFNNHDFGAVYVDDGVICTMQEIRGALIGNPIQLSVSSEGNTEQVKTRIYARYGAKLTVTNLDELPKPNNVDVNFFIHFAELTVLTKTKLQNVLAYYSTIRGNCIMGNYVYAFNTLFTINAVDISCGANQYLSSNCCVKARGVVDTADRLSVRSVLDKKCVRQFTLDIASGNAYNGAPIGVLQCFIGSVGTGGARIAYWNGTTYVKVNVGTNHESVYSSIGAITAHRWSINEIEGEEIPETLKGYVGVVNFNS